MRSTALITGSTSGIGKATAEALSQLKWNIIIHGSREEKCRKTVQEIMATTGNPNIAYVSADLSDLSAVNKMADQIIEKHPGVKLLINNAGTFSKMRQITVDGLERTWVVNYLSRFLLTHRLLPILKKNGPGRIVDVSGLYHNRGEIHFEDLSLARNYSLMRANSQSKLANVLFTYKLARELDGSPVTINTLHPGAVNTGSILRSDEFSTFIKWLYRLMSPFLKTPEQGAANLIYLASSAELAGVSGKYFVNKKRRRSSKASYDKELQDKLWEVSWDILKKNSSYSAPGV